MKNKYKVICIKDNRRSTQTVRSLKEAKGLVTFWKKLKAKSWFEKESGK